MACKPRLNTVGIPQHNIQRGNNRQDCFASDEDMATYMHWLHESADEYCESFTNEFDLIDG